MKEEHALINALISLMCKGGCESFVGNFQRDANVLVPKDNWTPEQIAEATHYVEYMNEYFGKQEAIAVVTSLIAKFHINKNELAVPDGPHEKVGLES